ncbi:acyloxyacyl hydrolase-like isoform X2 [Neocloeon triangulifer]|uniref:acyloxyacyl hydrolase-like isoform X2 n=1 Tax=Neocloeon triangulifer TaxID=2078957 RepID=UPI00286F964C|nr:acyloxyacyl hydrolase-like isoform X2 [Neocloeon triangulifer]
MQTTNLKITFFVIFLPWLLLFDVSDGRGINGGLDCAVCTVVLGLSIQVAQINNETIVSASTKLCSLLPSKAASTCINIVNEIEPALLSKELFDVVTPDVICYGVGLCYKSPGEKYCHLFPKPNVSGFHSSVTKATLKSEKQGWNLCSLPGIKDICEDINRSLERIQPAVDVDTDWFSTVQSARGSFWRGKDCDDTDTVTYPGRQPVLGDAFLDTNCNGIFGIDPSSATAWETILCTGAIGRGLIYMGDSVGAHFHFPERWMDPLQVAQINPWKIPTELVQNVTQWILNEGDWPHLGFATGYQNNTQPSLIKGPVDSIYLRMLALNRCNHRDYQNLSRNGAATNTVLAYMQSVARNATKDRPVLFIYGLYGNDVCNNVKDTVANMTTPEELRKNVMEVLEFVDTVLPEGSHVLVIGMVDASFIYPAMHKLIHPLGRLHNDITYENLYDWFSCMQIGPCNGWMTANETLRAITSKASKRLSKELEKLASSQTFKNFKLHYLDNPLGQVMKEWVSQGHEVFELIDPIDSLHPSQMAQTLITDVLWRNIMVKFPYIVGSVNPQNSRIQEIFGDQGGH